MAVISKFFYKATRLIGNYVALANDPAFREDPIEYKDNFSFQTVKELETPEGCNSVIDELNKEIDYYSSKEGKKDKERVELAKELIRTILLIHGDNAKVNESMEYPKYKASSYYGNNYSGLEADLESDDWSEIEDFCHDMLIKGGYCEIKNNESGKSVRIDPDEYLDSFDGEFIYKASDLEESVNEDIKRYSDVYDDATRQRGWWYFTTHGVQPGSIPKDLHVLEVRDGKNEKGTMGTFVRLDGILNTSELREFDMKEMRPMDESLEEAKDDFSYERQLLGRLKADCDYVLNTCVGENKMSLASSQKHLWAGSTGNQIAKMRELHQLIPDADSIVTDEQINDYEQDFKYAWEKENVEESLTESDLKERNLTRAERHNKNMEKIFSHKRATDKAMKDYLIQNGVSEDEAERLYNADRLDNKLIELGLHDDFFKMWNSKKYDFDKNGTFYLIPEDLNEKKSVKESLDDVWADYESIEKFLKRNKFDNYELVDYSDFPMQTSRIAIEIDGDWKHDHGYFKYLIKEWAKENNRDIFKIDEDVEPSDSDWYKATYYIYITKDKESYDRLNSMRGLFAESKKMDKEDEYKTLAKLSKGLEVISYPYGYAISDGYVTDRLVVRGDKYVLDDGRFRLNDKDKEKILRLIQRGVLKESLKEAKQWSKKYPQYSFEFSDGWKITASSEDEAREKYQDIQGNKQKGSRGKNEIDNIAQSLYDNGDEWSFNYFSDKELATLWALCGYGMGRAYDDEVYEAIHTSPNSAKIFKMAETIYRTLASVRDRQNGVETLHEDKEDDAYEALKAAVSPMTDDFHEAESDLSDFYMTWNFGLQEDGFISAGVDIRMKRDSDEAKAEEVKKKIEAIFEKHGFELDKNFPKNPGKTLFGSIHYQIISKKKLFDESLTENLGSDYSNIPLIDRIDFNNQAKWHPNITPFKGFIDSLNSVGEDCFKVRSNRMGTSMHRFWWAMEDFFRRFEYEKLGEDVLHRDCYLVKSKKNLWESLREAKFRTDVIDSGYDDSGKPWADVKKELIQKYKKKGYTNVEVQRNRTDTKGLKMYSVYGTKNESLTESRPDGYSVSDLERAVRSALSRFGFDAEHGYDFDFISHERGSVPYLEAECADGIDEKDFSLINRIFSRGASHWFDGFDIDVFPGKEHKDGGWLSLIFEPRGMKHYFNTDDDKYDFLSGEYRTESLKESNTGKCISNELSEKTNNDIIKNLCYNGELTIIKDGDLWYTDDCPVRHFALVKDEMKKWYPELTYMYDKEPHKSKLEKSIMQKLKKNESLNEARPLAKSIMKRYNKAYKSFDSNRDWVRGENDRITKRWNEVSNGTHMDDETKDFLLKKEPSFDNYKPNIASSLEQEEYPFYVTVYEETPYYHPEEGGYYVAGRTAISSYGFENRAEAIQYAKELADDYDLQRLSDTHYSTNSKYIGDNTHICVETSREYLKFEKGDEMYESLTEDTIKTKDGKWTNKGKEGTHGKFKTKKEADAQRRAIWANWKK